MTIMRRTARSKDQFTISIYISDRSCGEVKSICSKGMMRVVIPWYTIENIAEIIDWEAITEAMMLRIRKGIYSSCISEYIISKRIFCAPG
jgi:hypothetical protein